MGKVENDLKTEILDLLALYHIKAFRVQSGKVRVRGGYMHLAPEGTSDLIGYMPYTGRILAIETKVKGENPRKSQIEFLSAVRSAHGIAMVVNDPVQFERRISELIKQDKEISLIFAEWNHLKFS
jgi:hypothetical protein